MHVKLARHPTFAVLDVATFDDQNGRELDRVMSTNVEDDREGYEQDTPPPPACTSIGTSATTTVAVGKSRSHGLADLQLVTVQTPRYDFDKDPSKCPALSPKKNKETLRYDGKVYK